MSDQLTLFALPEKTKDDKNTSLKSKPRITTAQRDQYEIRSCVLDDIIPKDHLARSVWSYVEKLDFSITLGKIHSVVGSAGRPAIDPKILFALWMFATIKSINSSRVIVEYTLEHDAFKWLCGGVKVNYHTIADFRTDHCDQFNDLLTQSVAVLASSGIISLEEVSQDGMRVRAHAGGSSFRREESLEFLLELSKMYLDDLNKEAKIDPSRCKSRLASGERRAAEEKVQKLESALKNLAELRSDKEVAAKNNGKKFGEDEKKKVRASLTDPEARIMKMACAGYRPAYNVQFASTNVGKAIVCVDVINKGSDSGQAGDMIRQFHDRYGLNPKNWSVDSGFDAHKEAEFIKQEFDCSIYMPMKYATPVNVSDKKKKSTGYVSKEKMRSVMESSEAKEIYKQRCETAEYVNAQTRNMGFQQFVVRGLKKVKCATFLYAIAHNLTLALNNLSAC